MREVLVVPFLDEQGQPVGATARFIADVCYKGRSAVSSPASVTISPLTIETPAAPRRPRVALRVEDDLIG